MAQIFDHPWLGGWFGDAQCSALWSAQAQLDAIRAYEAAWSRALGRLGLVSPEMAEAAAQAIGTMHFDLADLRAGMAADGMVTPRLLHQMQAAAGTASAAVHHGASAQDLIDTCLSLSIKATLNLLETRLLHLQGCLTDLATEQGETAMLGRIRMRVAAEIRAEDRIASWALPLQAHLQRLTELRPRVELLQLGGIAGDRSALGGKALAMAEAMANALDLGNPPRGWHSMRDGLGEFAGLLSLISGSLGKMGQDIALMAQDEINEISCSPDGAAAPSPALAELLVTLARYNAGALASMHHALVHEQEGSGAAWALEWMILPDMAQATARSLAVACQLCAQTTRIGRA